MDVSKVRVFNSLRGPFMRMKYIVTLSILFSGLGAAQDQMDQGPQVRDAGFVMVGDTVIITYKLTASDEEWFDVRVALRRGDDTTFAIVPQSAVGGIGIVQGGGEKVILWDYKKDTPPSFEYGDDYWFEITASPVDRGLQVQWWHYAAGAGIVAAVLVATRSGGDGGTGQSLLPEPPRIRPIP